VRTGWGNRGEGKGQKTRWNDEWREREARGRPRRRWEESFGFQALRCPVREDETNEQNGDMFIAVGVTVCGVLPVRGSHSHLVQVMQRTPHGAIAMLCSHS
jgi:hypothetical protein